MDKHDFRSGNIFDIKKKQWRYLIGVIVMVFVVGWGVFSVISESSSTKNNTHLDKSTSVNMASPLTHVNEASVWVERTQNTLAKAMKTTESLEQQLEILRQSKSAQEKSTQAQNQQVEALQNRLNDLEQKINQTQSHANSTVSLPGNANKNTEIGDMHPGMPGVSENVLTLSPRTVIPDTPLIPSRTPDTYVPTGTFVRAVMLGGADASAGVNGQGNPTPMLFRLLDQGTLPNHRKSHLKDCAATAAVVGDISSERGQIRLERLSCVAPNGEVLDMPVEGTVFGSEGKNGVRGIPLWREGALLKRALMAGTLSGLSHGVAQQYTTTSVSPLGSSTNVQDGALFKYGAATGVSNAMDKMADYHIRRADQYHPVIQLSAGTVVDIVFLKGFFLDGEKHDDPKKEVVLPPFSTAVPSVTTPLSFSTQPSTFLTTLPLTPQQIHTLKTKTNPDSGL